MTSLGPPLYPPPPKPIRHSADEAPAPPMSFARHLLRFCSVLAALGAIIGYIVFAVHYTRAAEIVGAVIVAAFLLLGLWLVTGD